MTAKPDELSSVHLLFVLIGAGLYLVAGFLVGASLIVVPGWVVVVLLVVWLASGIWAARRWQTSRFALVWAGLISLGAWIVAVAIGDRTLGLWG